MDTIDSETPNSKRPRRLRLRWVAVACAVPASLLLTAAAANAANGDDPDPDAVSVEDVSVEDETFDCGPPLTAEEIADLQADEDALDAYLDARDVAHSWSEPDVDGLRVVEWDYEDDAANAAVDAFWAERYPLTAEEIAEYNAEADGLAAHLESKGIDHEVVDEADGTRWVEWDYGDDAANEVVDAYYAAVYPLTAEEIESINADADGLAAHLESKGIDHEVVHEADGTRWVEWDYEDDAANAAVDEWYGTNDAASDTVAC